MNEDARKPKPTDDLFANAMANPTPPGYCRPGLGCRYCWPTECRWRDTQEKEAR